MKPYSVISVRPQCPLKDYTMSINILAFTIATLGVMAGNSSDSGTMPVDNEHFLIYGEIIEMDPVAAQERDADGTQVIVYQDGEIYVTFNADEKGEYKFNLPVNHNYSVVYGGEDFVNKEILIDAYKLPKNKHGQNVQLDLGLLKDFEGVDYSFLNAPVALISYDELAGELSYDKKHYKRQSKAMYKCMKQILKMHG